MKKAKALSLLDKKLYNRKPPVFVNWKILLASVSGLNVSGLSVTGEHYKPYKGVRNITQSGSFQIRV